MQPRGRRLHMLILQQHCAAILFEGFLLRQKNKENTSIISARRLDAQQPSDGARASHTRWLVSG